MKVGQRIIDLRTAMGMSGNQLAKNSGLAQSTISSIESGKTSPSVDSLELICRAFGISIIDFFSDGSVEYPADIQQLIETTKKLPTDERKALNEFLKVRLSVPEVTKSEETETLNRAARDGRAKKLSIDETQNKVEELRKEKEKRRKFEQKD